MLSGQDRHSIRVGVLPEPKKILVGAWEDPPLAFAQHPVKPMSAPPTCPQEGDWIGVKHI